MRRVTCESPGLRTFVPLGPDEYVGLLMPPAGRPLVMPDPEPVNVRASVAAIPEPDRPALRWYTIRDHDPVRGPRRDRHHDPRRQRPRLGLDLPRPPRATPSASGPLVRSTAGSRSTAGRCWSPTRRPCRRSRPSSMPGAAPIDARDQGVEVHVEVADPAVLAPTTSATPRARRTGRPGSALVPALDRALAAGGAPIGYAWACGESDLAAGARRMLRAPRRRPAQHLLLRLLEARAGPGREASPRQRGRWARAR